MSAIHEAINKVMDEVGYVKKSRAQSLNYSFAGEAALIAALRPSMVEHGIFMSVSKIHLITRENYTTAKGTAMVNTVIHADVTFTHTSGDSITVTAVGEGSDSGDKSANKAMTGLYKYALRQTFCIETGDDPDKYPSEARDSELSGKKPEPKPAAKVQNEIITASEWENFTKYADEARAKVPNIPHYERAKMSPASINGAKKYIEQELKKLEGAK